MCALCVHYDWHGVLSHLWRVFIQDTAAATHGAGVADILWVCRTDELVAAVEHCRHVPDYQIDDNACHHRHSVRFLLKTFLTPCQADTGILFHN